MEINLWVIAGIIARVAAILGIVFFVLPQQWREINEPRSEFTVYRWILIGMSFVFITLSVLPFLYQLGRIESSSGATLQNLASFSSNLALLVLVGLYTAIYIIANKNRRR